MTEVLQKAMGSLENQLLHFETQNMPDIVKELDQWLDGEYNCNISSIERVHELLQILEDIKKSKSEQQTKKSKEKLFFIFQTDAKKREQYKIDNNNKKKTEEVTRHMSEKDPSIPVYSYKDIQGLLINSQRKVSNLRYTNEQEALKLEKTRSLLDICEALSSVKSKHTESQLVLREKLLQTLDAFVMQYGGVAFFAPLDIESNASIGATRKTDTFTLEEMKFIDYVWSTSTENYVTKMASFGLRSPQLANAPMFRTVLLSRRFMMIDTEKVNLPENHFPLETALLIPVVINKQSVAMLGLGNGKYNQMDASILYEILPKIWTDVILESVAKANKKHEDTVRLQNVEKRVEMAKKMLLQLNQVMQDDDDIVVLTKEKYLRQKLKEMANFFEDEFGGLVFVAPTKVEININLLSLVESSESGSSGGSDKEGQETKNFIDQYEFMSYVFSNSARQIRKTVMKNFKKPVLKNSMLFKKAVESQQPMYFSDTSKMKLPNGHFPMSSVLLVPIVVNLECCGLVGIANGKTDKLSGDVIFDVLSTSWFTILQQCFSRIDLRYKERIINNTLLQDVNGNSVNNSAFKRKGSITDISVNSQNTVLVFIKLTGIVKLCKVLDADHLIEMINSFYAKFDKFSAQCGIEKIDTFSDFYIAGLGHKDMHDSRVAGNPLYACANFAIAVRDLMNEFNKNTEIPDELKENTLNVKVAIGTGFPLLTGTFESSKVDIFGDLCDQTKKLALKSPIGSIGLTEKAMMNHLNY
eukprot:gene10623-3246_t